MKSSRKLLLVLCAVVAALVTATAAQAYTRPTDPASVAIIGCATQGGVRTVPADTPITVFAGWESANRGLVTEAVNGSTNTLSVDGGPGIDLAPYFQGPEPRSEWNPNGTNDWVDFFFYTVPAVALGQSETVAYTYIINHKMSDGLGNTAERGDTHTFTCTLVGT